MRRRARRVRHRAGRVRLAGDPADRAAALHRARGLRHPARGVRRLGRGPLGRPRLRDRSRPGDRLRPRQGGGAARLRRPADRHRSRGADHLPARPAQLPHAGVGRARRGALVGRAAADAGRARLEHARPSGSTPSTRRRTAPSARRGHEPSVELSKPRRSERGSVTPLIIGFAVVVAMLVAVVVDASAAYLRRQGLNSAADAAALAATDGIQGEEVYTHGLGERAEIDPAAARRYVADYFASSGIRRRFPGLDYSVADDGQHRRRPPGRADGPAAARARRRHGRAGHRHSCLGRRRLGLTGPTPWNRRAPARAAPGLSGPLSPAVSPGGGHRGERQKGEHDRLQLVPP